MSVDAALAPAAARAAGGGGATAATASEPLLDHRSSVMEMLSYTKHRHDALPLPQHLSLCDSWFPVIYPTELWKERWDMVVMCLIVYSACSVPVRVCFGADAEGAMWCFEVACSFCFLFDLSLAFRLAYLHEGEWITDRYLITKSCAYAQSLQPLRKLLHSRPL